MKGPSEGKVRKALSEIDSDGDLALMILKFPDDGRNWKPADFAVWSKPSDCFIEVKDSDTVRDFPLASIRLSQWKGAEDAKRVGKRYWFVIWRRHEQRWLLVDGTKLLDIRRDGVKSVAYSWLISAGGIDCEPGQLKMMLRAMIQGELS